MAFTAAIFTEPPCPAQDESHGLRCDVTPIAQALDEHWNKYLASGRAEEARARFLSRLAVQDAGCGKTPGYLELKATYLSLAGEDQAAEATIAEVRDEDVSQPVHFGNRLRRRYATDPKAALLMLRRATAGGQAALQRRAVRWIHEELAQNYAPEIKERVRTPVHEDFLAALGDPSFPCLAEATAALRLWTRALPSAADPDRLRAFAEESWAIIAPDARPERYRLLIATLMDGLEVSSSDAVALREQIINEIQMGAPDGPSMVQRYWLAYAHYSQARSFEGRDALRARREYRQAAHKAPSWEDASAAFYESVCLGGPREIRSACSEGLQEMGALEEALEIEAELALHSSSRMDAVRSLHARIRSKLSFERFWDDTLDRHLPPAPSLELARVEGGRLLLESLRGRWVVLDFWGTWCEPCVVEMPRLQELHEELTARAAGSATVLTVACNDQPEAVRAFLQQNRYTFPVLIGDDGTEPAFGITEYPSKRLVTPTGRLMTLREDDWLETVRAHVFGEAAREPASR